MSDCQYLTRSGVCTRKPISLIISFWKSSCSVLRRDAVLVDGGDGTVVVCEGEIVGIVTRSSFERWWARICYCCCFWMVLFPITRAKWLRTAAVIESISYPANSGGSVFIFQIWINSAPSPCRNDCFTILPLLGWCHCIVVLTVYAWRYLLIHQRRLTVDENS